MNEREVTKVLAEALDRKLLLSYTRMRHGWKVHERRSGPKVFSKAEAISYARRIKQRL